MPYFNLSKQLSLPTVIVVAVALLVGSPLSRAGETDGDAAAAGEPNEAALREAAEQALALLEKASAGSAEQRICFTCHSQAMPVLALTEARDRGFTIDEDNYQRQLEHTAAHLGRGRKDYLEGRGQGGKSDTAGYALWTLDAGGFEASETTGPVVDWVIEQQDKAGYWKRSSNRPPSEASRFTTTFLALRALKSSQAASRDDLVDRFDAARRWLIKAQPKDTEDRVFRLMALQLMEAGTEEQTKAADELLATQRDDGGWAQTESLESDAYATGSALYALERTGRAAPDDEAFVSGLRYLLQSQQDDGSWHVVSRSVPFQTYYETGFPHGTDQFISTSATAWATLALLAAIPHTAE